MRIRYKAKRIGGPGEVLDRHWFELSVYDDDLKWPILRDLAAEHGVKVFSSATFTNDDIAAAPWLFAYATADAGCAQPQKNFGLLGAAFDLTHHCERCGIGKFQSGPFRLSAEPNSKRAHFFAPRCPQTLFARNDVREMFESEGVSGARYLPPLRHRTGNRLETIVQILPTTTLDNGLVSAAQEQVICSPTDHEMKSILTAEERKGTGRYGHCGRVKFHVPYRRRLVHYSHDVLVRAPDIVLSVEWFGSGGVAAQQVIVSNKVARLVLAHGWKGLELQPIELVSMQLGEHGSEC